MKGDSSTPGAASTDSTGLPQNTGNPLVETLRAALRSPNAIEREDAIRSLNLMLNGNDPELAQYARVLIGQVSQGSSEEPPTVVNMSVVGQESSHGRVTPATDGKKDRKKKLPILLWVLLGLSGLALISILAVVGLLATGNTAVREVPVIGAKAQAQPYIAAGMAYYNIGNNDKAIEEFTKAIDTDPANAEAYTNRASANLQKQNGEQALTDYTKAVTLAPNRPQTQVIIWLVDWLKKGVRPPFNPLDNRPIPQVPAPIDQGAENPPEGTSDTEAKPQPSDCVQKPELEGFIKPLEKRCNENRDMWACTMAGISYTSQGDFLKAHELFLTYPDLSDPQLDYYVKLYGNHNNLPLQVMGVGPGDQNSDRSGIEQWLEEYPKIKALPPEEKEKLGLELCKITLGGWSQEEAGDCGFISGKEWLLRDIDEARLWSYKCWRDYRSNRLESALKACEMALKIKPEECTARWGLGMINLAQGNTEEAAANCLAGCKDWPDYTQPGEQTLDNYKAWISQQVNLCRSDALAKQGKCTDAQKYGEDAKKISLHEFKEGCSSGALRIPEEINFYNQAQESIGRAKECLGIGVPTATAVPPAAVEQTNQCKWECLTPQRVTLPSGCALPAATPDCIKVCVPVKGGLLHCGNGYCSQDNENNEGKEDETNCPADCNRYVKDDGVCSYGKGENERNSPPDCGGILNLCGNNICDMDVGETKKNCPLDCK